MVIKTEKSFEVSGEHFKRIYFHSPIKYSTILRKYKNKILSFSDLIELKNISKGKNLKIINSWNLCSDIFSEITSKSFKINSTEFNFKIKEKSRFSLYLGIEPKIKEKRVCLFSPENIIYLDANPNWKTFGFGIIVSKNKRKSKKLASINIMNIEVIHV